MSEKRICSPKASSEWRKTFKREVYILDSSQRYSLVLIAILRWESFLPSDLMDSPSTGSWDVLKGSLMQRMKVSVIVISRYEKSDCAIIDMWGRHIRSLSPDTTLSWYREGIHPKEEEKKKGSILYFVPSICMMGPVILSTKRA